jgi:dolichol-phosphate mannosyltransferase
MLLSIITPVYNERRTIAELVRRVEAVDFGNTKVEIILVDDGSTDGTRNILRKMQRRHTVLFHDQNQGKGAAIRTGLTVAKGDVIVVQDADLEYDPNDLKVLLREISEGKHDIVYGSRVLGRKKIRYSTFIFHVGGNLITWWTNLLFGTHITDEATCYKMFTRRVLKDITLESNRFEFCPELTGKAVNAGYKIKEVPISYHPRNAKEGKKLKLRDGIEALWALTKVKLFNRL